MQGSVGDAADTGASSGALQRGQAALAAGDVGEAVQLFRAAMAEAPLNPAIYANLAAALLAIDQPALAEEVSAIGLTLAPCAPALLLVRAQAHRAQGRLAEAARCLGLALEIEPAYLAARLGLDDLLFDQGEPEAAAEHYRCAATVGPGNRAALGGLALCHLQAGDRHGALALYRELVDQDPADAAAQGNLGQTLQGLGRHDEAVVAFRRALALDPALDRLKPFLLQSLNQQCAFVEGAALEAELLAAWTRGERATLPSPFALAGTAAPPALRLELARAYAKRLAPATPISLHHRRRETAGRPLVVGYVSPDFRRHSLGLAFAALLAAHGRDGFRWLGYSLSREPADDLTRRLAAGLDRLVDLRPLTPRQMAERIAGDGVDILVDLAGPTRDSALEVFAFRPAPVQVHYLGYASTLGSDSIDYLLTDAIHTPPALAVHCQEALAYLPDSFMAAPTPPLAAPPTRAEAGLPGDALVFCNFNAHAKFDGDSFAAWLGLLRALPQAVLWLKQGSDTAMANLRQTAATAGIAADRLIFAARLPYERHLARQQLADLALDCWRHAGGVTTLDALWAGVPVLTLAGDNHAQRTGASILSALGLPELIADSAGEYQRSALRFASDRHQLAAAKSRLAGQRHSAPLFQAGRLAGHLEAAYRAMFQRWRSGLPPASFRVVPRP